jgi:DNA-binding NtrC family response regulator
MNKQPFALLIHEPAEHFECLRESLKQLSVHTYSISTCRQAENLLSQCKPDLIFTESCVEDGSWLTILNLAEATRVPLSVVVVGSQPDTQLYTSVMELGAFDFVVPPFERESLDFVVKSAALNTHRLRGVMVHAAVAS